MVIGNLKIDRSTNSEAHNASLNLDLLLGQKSSLSLSGNVVYTPYWKRSTEATTEAFDNANQLDSLFNSLNLTKDDKINANLSVGYDHQGEKGEKFSVLLHHTYYDGNRTQDVNTNYHYPENMMIRNNRFNSESTQQIKIYTAQLDYQLPIENGGVLETGAKGIVISTDSDLQQFYVINGSQVVDPNNTNTFLYDEKNAAAYLSYSKNSEKWGIAVGVRGEYTQTEGHQLVTDELNTNEYFSLFPTASFKYHASDSHDFTLSYKKRIERPVYQDLNPFKYFLTDNSYTSGSPYLEPTIQHYGSLDYTFKGAYTFSVFYRHREHPMAELSFLENDNAIIKYVTTNMKNNTGYGFDFIVSKPITRFWYLYLESTYYKNQVQFYAVENSNQLVPNDRWTGYVSANNYLTLLKDQSLGMEVSYLYTFPMNDGNFVATARSKFSIGFNKSLWKERAAITFKADDIFDGFNFTSSSAFLDQQINYKARYETRTFMLGFRYKFGNYRLRVNTPEQELEERDRIKD